MDVYVTVAAAIVGLGTTFLLGYPLIPYLKKLKFGQTILDIGPNWHKSKEGTPTMGGIMMMLGFAVAMIVAYIVAAICGGSIAKHGLQLLYVLSGIGLSLGMGFLFAVFLFFFAFINNLFIIFETRCGKILDVCITKRDSNP